MGRRTLLLITSILIAAVGTALVAIYVRGADERAEEGTTLVSVVVATKKVNANDSLQSAIEDASFSTERVLQRTVADDALTSESQLKELSDAGQVPAGPILPGQVIQKAMFQKSGVAVDTGTEKGRLRMAVQMADPNRSAGFLAQGSRVAVFITTGEGEEQRTFCLIPDVKVLSVGATGATLQRTSATTDQNGDGGNGDGNAAAEEPVPSTIVSLSVDQLQAQKLIFGTKAGELYFAILGEGTVVNPSQGATSSSNLTTR
jgi:pilus assembly protein CpaB